MLHNPTISEIKPIVLKITDKYGVTNVRIFGSFARGEQSESSDIDLLVDFPEKFTLLQHSGLKIDLEEALERKVDVVSGAAIKPRLKKYILPEAKTL